MSDVRGIGLDLCGIARMADKLDNERFLSRICTSGEIAYLRSRGQMAAASLAAMWAAKEAALKALGVGITLPMTDVEVLHDEAGRPSYALHGQAAVLCGGGTLLLSITHECDMAAAMCVWQA